MTGKVPLASSESRVNYGPLQQFLSWWFVFLCYPLHWIIASILLTVFLLCYSARTRIFMILYLFVCFVIDKHRGDGKGWYLDWEWLKVWNKRRHIWKVCTSYYPMKLYKTAELSGEDGRQYMFVTHPHGVFGVTTQGSMATFACGLDELYPWSIASRIRIIGLDVMFRIPFFREYVIAVGCASSSKDSFRRIFKRGEHVCLNVGGAAEALVETEARSSEMRCILKERKGFVKIALQHGATLVPCVAYEENSSYNILQFEEGSFMRKLQYLLQKKLRFSLPFFWGNMVPTQPLRKELSMYVGGGLDCERIESPTQEDIDRKHAEYCEALERLFDDYKEHAGHPDWKLSIIDDPGKKLMSSMGKAKSS